ncbi:MAG: alpha/beta hydrolase [Solirubrobacterales bacterium]|nr:alpha/beta hydrolase [Solirubrobacterales bacterium]
MLLLIVLVAFAPGAKAVAAEPARVLSDIDYNLDATGPSQPGANCLDLYLPPEPDGAGQGLRPVVVWVHGGGWMNGDKKNRMTDKARLFNDLGYVVASLNYRLSPDISGGGFDGSFDPGRVRAPDHVRDVAEAIRWLSRNVASHGGDPDRIVLVGHSAGAHLVSLLGTNPSWLAGRAVSEKQILGVVSLDTETFDVREEADPGNPLNSASRLALIWNAFGTPDEEAVDPRWADSSPQVAADPSDPPFLLVTQSARALRMASNNEFATSLGEDPASAVVGVPLDHEGINTALGSATDTTVETARVSAFVRDVIAGAKPAGVKVTRRPARRVVIRAPRHRRVKPRKVAFAFRGTGRATGFQCRIDRQRFRSCRSPRSFRVRPGRHVFRVRPLNPSGRPGGEKAVTFRVVVRRVGRSRTQ